MARTQKREFTGSKKSDRSCRNGGSCEHCRSNRLHKHAKKIEATEKELKNLVDSN